MFRFACCLLTILIVTGSSHAEDGASHALAYRFAPGQFLHYEIDHRSDIHVQHGSAEQEVAHSSRSWRHYRVVTITPEGNAALEMAIDRVQMQAKTQDAPGISYDSHSDVEPPAAFGQVRQTVGRPLVRITVTPTGEVLQVTPLHKSVADQRSLDEKNFNVLARLPDQPVKIGDRWTEQFEIEINATDTLRKRVRMQRSYRLTGVDDGIATIAVKTVAISPLHDPAEEAQVVQKTSDGTVTFDIAAGRLVERAATTDRRVVGFSGPQTLMEVKASRSEQLVGPNAATANADRTPQTR